MNCLQVLVTLVSVSSLYVTATYICVCNRDFQPYPVFDSMQSGIGYLNPNSCAAVVNTTGEDLDEDWIAITFNQQDGYIAKNESLFLDECDGGVTIVKNTTISSALLGHVKQCPTYVVQGAKSNGYLLTQHGHSCYEVCQDKVSWTHAHMLCTERGGHLVSIHNDLQNKYLHSVLTHAFNHRVWIGLHDREHEEHFEWTTGEKVAYTHWKPHHRKSSNHTHEDCVLMLSSGYWDDVQCGANSLGHEAARMTAPYVCEYKVHSTGSFIIG